jgi:GAF domain-containing protein
MIHSPDPEDCLEPATIREPPRPPAGEPSAAVESLPRFLADASQCLAASLDYEETLVTVAGMALPYLGSWCIVDLVEADGSMRRLGIIHPDPLKQERARALKEGWPPGRTDPIGLPRVIRSRETELIPTVSDEMLVEFAMSEENLQDLRALGIGSVVVVPLIARNRVLGAITFVSADVGHQYTERDVELAEDLAARCSIALDNARLFRDLEETRKNAAQLNEQLVVSSIRQQELAEEARDANHAKSRFLATMSHEIRTPINAIVGYTDLLEMGIAGEPTPGQREYLARVKASSNHLIQLIDDILDLAKVESGRMTRQGDPLGSRSRLGRNRPDRAPSKVGRSRPQRRVPRCEQLLFRRQGSGPSDPGDPLEQRAQVHRSRRYRYRELWYDLDAGRGSEARRGRPVDIHPGGGHRHWHLPGGGGGDLQAVRPGRLGAYPQTGRHRARTLHRS